MATITTINGTDNITDSRAVINTNFTNLNTDKAESSALTAGLALKVDKVTGKSLINDTDITKLAGIEAGAEVNNISDTNATDLTDGGDTTLHTHDGRYYTETETNSLLSGKQNTLTAGTNITIVGDTISSTGGGATTLDGLTDVTITTPATGQALTYNGTIWVNTTPAGGGDVVGPASSTDNAIARFDGTTGKLLQNSVVAISDIGAITGVGTISASNNITTTNYLRANYNSKNSIFAGGGIKFEGATYRGLYDNSGNELINFPLTDIVSAVNEITISNAATGNGPILEATGNDTNIDLNLKTKGTGVVKVNGTAIFSGNTAITGATKTKITYDAKGLVTAGADATSDDITEGTTNKYLSATQKTDLTDGGVTSLHTHNTSLDDLFDVSIALPITQGQSLVYNGVEWINLNPTPVVGSASTLYLDATSTIADNLYLNTSPSSFPQTIKTSIVDADINGGIGFLERFVSGPLGRTNIPAGDWTFNTYASTSNNTGTDTIQVRVNKRVEISGMTGTFTGAGTTRTFTVTGGTPFVPGDAGTNLTASLIETPTQSAWISTYISSSQVKVTLTDSGYVNETGVALNAIYYLLFNSGETSDITGTSPVNYVKTITQPAFVVKPTDRIVTAYFAKTTSGTNRTIGLYYGGTAAYSNVKTPINTNHNDLGGLNEGEFIHLTTAEKAKLDNQSGTNTGDETATTIGALIGGAGDATPNDTDYVATSLTAGGLLKKITWTNVKAFLKTYFNTLYANIAGSITQSFGASTIELGHRTDTTLSRVSAGVVAVEGIQIISAGSTTVGQVPTITGTNTYSWQTPSGGGGVTPLRITIPGEQIADTANYQGMYFYNNSGATRTISDVDIAVGKARAGTGRACAVNLYKSSGTRADGINTNAVNLFTSAIDLGTGYTSLNNVPNTTTVESGKWLSLRVTSSAGATNKASDLQVVITYA